MTNKLEEIILETKDKALNFLSHKARSRKEIDDRISYYLKKHDELGESQKEDIKFEIIKEFESHNLINDQNYAETFVKEKINSPKTTSKNKIKQFLKRKGIKDSIIEQSLTLFLDELEEENMEKDALKKISALKETNYVKKKSKLVSYLSSRGYPYSKIYTVVDRVLGVK